MNGNSLAVEVVELRAEIAIADDGAKQAQRHHLYKANRNTISPGQEQHPKRQPALMGKQTVSRAPDQRSDQERVRRRQEGRERERESGLRSLNAGVLYRVRSEQLDLVAHRPQTLPKHNKRNKM